MSTGGKTAHGWKPYKEISFLLEDQNIVRVYSVPKASIHYEAKAEFQWLKRAEAMIPDYNL